MTNENTTCLEEGKLTKEMRMVIKLIRKLLSVSPTSGTQDFIIAGILLSEHFEYLAKHNQVTKGEQFHLMVNDVCVTVESADNNPELQEKLKKYESKDRNDDKAKEALLAVMENLDSIINPVKH